MRAALRAERVATLVLAGDVREQRGRAVRARRTHGVTLVCQRQRKRLGHVVVVEHANRGRTRRATSDDIEELVRGTLPHVALMPARRQQDVPEALVHVHAVVAPRVHVVEPARAERLAPRDRREEAIVAPLLKPAGENAKEKLDQPRHGTNVHDGQTAVGVERVVHVAERACDIRYGVNDVEADDQVVLAHAERLGDVDLPVLQFVTELGASDVEEVARYVGVRVRALRQVEVRDEHACQPASTGADLENTRRRVRAYHGQHVWDHEPRLMEKAAVTIQLGVGAIDERAAHDSARVRAQLAPMPLDVRERAPLRQELRQMEVCVYDIAGRLW